MTLYVPESAEVGVQSKVAGPLWSSEDVEQLGHNDEVIPLVSPSTAREAAAPYAVLTCVAAFPSDKFSKTGVGVLVFVGVFVCVGV